MTIVPSLASEASLESILEHLADELEARDDHAPFGDWLMKATIRTMMVNVEVYAMADKFNILLLKETALKKITSLSDSIDSEWFSNSGLADVFLEAIRSTPSNDRGLRPIIVDLCALHMDTILGSRNDKGDPGDHEQSETTRAMWEPVLKADQDFQYEVLRVSAQANSERLAKSTESYERRMGAMGRRLGCTELGHDPMIPEIEVRSCRDYHQYIQHFLEKATNSYCATCGQTQKPIIIRRDEDIFALRCRSCLHYTGGYSSTLATEDGIGLWPPRPTGPTTSA